MKKIVMAGLLAGSLLSNCSTQQPVLTDEQRNQFYYLNYYEQAKVLTHFNEEPVTSLPDNHLKNIFLLANNHHKRSAQNYLGNAVKNFVQPFLNDSIGVHTPGFVDFEDLTGLVVHLETKKEKRQLKQLRDTRILPDTDVYMMCLYHNLNGAESVLKYEFLEGVNGPSASLFTLAYYDTQYKQARVLSAVIAEDQFKSTQPLQDTSLFIEKSASLYHILRDLHE